MDSISSTWAPDFTLQFPAGQHQARLQCQELQEPASKGEWADVITLVTKISLPQRQIRMFTNTAINMAGKTGLPLKMFRVFCGRLSTPLA